MERTVPKSASDEIDLYIRTIYSLLRSTTDVQIRSLEEVHAGMNSSLHIEARKNNLDTSAFIYATLRLPSCIAEVNTIVLGQSRLVFARHGYQEVEKWQQVFTKARRRPTYYDNNGTLAVFIASQSDIEDVVPVLTAFQIEWNKIHNLLTRDSQLFTDQDQNIDPSKLAKWLDISLDDATRLNTIWGKDTGVVLNKIAQQRCNFKIRLLSGSLSEYWRATRIWYDNIEKSQPKLLDRPIYFISSNTHSIPNLLSGFALANKQPIIKYIEEGTDKNLQAEWKDLQASITPSSLENFLYYALKKFQQSEEGKSYLSLQNEDEAHNGIVRVPSEHSFDVETQVIELNNLDPSRLDPRLFASKGDADFLKNSNAMILNIDYPLGLGAYNILIKLAEHISEILGVYIMGKAATLNGVRGDVMIPNVVQDEHSQNTYLFQNVFSAADVMPNLVFGNVLDNQKALTVLGTFLQNARQMDVMYREGYTDIEMEAGPYLSAIFEMSRPKRHPVNEIVNLQGVSFDIGILHYASDTPLSKGKNLGAGTMSYEGVDCTYASSLAILRRIFSQERKRVGNSH
ncbi:MAG: hypothetical protein CVU42_10590 [Chloroflexi bacterium HGW-Chloroflexi-4]|jgi:hypothetical protein|nr:MAG: hypothetical protein CVU42_10590 [Chloroflexi bacterium HGW-Chloroflexi-4]